MRVDNDKSLPVLVILEPGDCLLMLAGLRGKYALSTLQRPSLRYGRRTTSPRSQFDGQIRGDGPA